MIDIGGIDPVSARVTDNAFAHLVDLHQFTNIDAIRVHEQGKVNISGIDLGQERAYNGRCAGRAVNANRGGPAIVLGGQQKFTEIADVIVMMMGEKDRVDLLRCNTHLQQLGGDAPPRVKEQVGAIELDQQGRLLTGWIEDRRASAEQD